MTAETSHDRRPPLGAGAMALAPSDLGTTRSALARSAASFDNPDHVAIVIHNSHWRLGLADGERRYDEMEKRLAEFPRINLPPAITLEREANGARHPKPSAYASRFAGPYEHRLVTGGVGHILPREAPAAFANAVIDLQGPVR